jgi:phospholipase C
MRVQRRLNMANQLSAIKHVVQLMLENRSFDQMLGFLYSDTGNQAPNNQPYEGLTGNESNPDDLGREISLPNRRNCTTPLPNAGC